MFYFVKSNEKNSDLITYENLGDFVGNFSARISKLLGTCSELNLLEKHNPDKGTRILYFPEFERTTFSEAVKLPSTYTEDYVEERIRIYEK